jgi:integrase
MSPALAGHAPANRKGKMPTEAVRFTKTQVEAKRTFKRKQYNDADMNAFFAGPIYTGHDNSVDRTAPGPFLVRDHMYWTPLLALYGGLCLEEALQLTTNCVEVVDGVAKVSIDPTKMTLKTMTREREIPLHPALLELGFMDHVERMRAAGHDRLFPEARQGGPDRRYGHKESQRFTAYRRAVGINEKGVDFHALRTSFSSTLMNKHQNQAVIADLMGHSQKGMTAEHYGGETELSTKTEALDALSYKAIDTRAMRELAEAAEAAGGVIPGREPPKPDRRRGRRNGTPPAARQRRAP